MSLTLPFRYLKLKMTMKPPDKKVIEIADFLFANPEKKTNEVVALFCTKLHKSERSVKSYIKSAKEYNKTRIAKQETIREKTLEKQTEKSAEKNILSRENALEILSTIALGKGKNVPTELKVSEAKEQIPTKYEIIYPSAHARIQAIGKLADMQGWDAPKKSEFTNTTPTLQIEVTGEKIKKTLENFFEKE